jgi:hypothetical protein
MSLALFPAITDLTILTLAKKYKLRPEVRNQILEPNWWRTAILTLLEALSSSLLMQLKVQLAVS